MKEAKLVGVTMTYEQAEDCCGRTDHEEQYLTVETQDGGGGPYLVLKTERWALDFEQINALAVKLQELLRNVGAGK